MTAPASWNVTAGRAGGAVRGGVFQIKTSTKESDHGAPAEGLLDGDANAAGAGNGAANFDSVLHAVRGQNVERPQQNAAQHTHARDKDNSRRGGSSEDGSSHTHDATTQGDADTSAQQTSGNADAHGGTEDPPEKKKDADESPDQQSASGTPADPAASALASGTVQAGTDVPPQVKAQDAGKDAAAHVGQQAAPGDGQSGAAPLAVGKAAIRYKSPALPDKPSKSDGSRPQQGRSGEKAQAKQHFQAVAEDKPPTANDQEAAQTTAEPPAPSAADSQASPLQNAASAIPLAKAAMAQQPQQPDANAAATTTQSSDVQAAATDNASPPVTTGDVASRLILAVGKDAGSEKGKAGASPATAPLGAAGAVQQAGSHAEVALKAQESPGMSAQETYDQIVLGLKGQMDPKSGKAQIMLDPPNLGAVKVSLSLANGVLTAQFESSTGAVRDLLKSNLDKLKTVLQGQGIAVDKLAVDAPATARDAGAAGGQMQQNASGSGAHDGRSAGGFGQESRSGQERWQPPNGANGFAQMFARTQDAPIDVVA